MFHPWEFLIELSFGSKHFSFHVLIFLLLGLPSACPVRKTSQYENLKYFLTIEKSCRSPPGMKNTTLLMYLISKPLARFPRWENVLTWAFWSSMKWCAVCTIMKKLFIRFNDIILPQNTQHQPTFGFAVVTQFGKITLKCLANAIVLIFQ